MENFLHEVTDGYLKSKLTQFQDNPIADRLRHSYPNAIFNILPDKIRYKVVGSPGKGKWTECPWIAILDILVTKSPQSGYYPVFLFKVDMTAAYLSMNQGVTEALDNYKRDAKNVLKLRAEHFGAKPELEPKDLINIDLNCQTNTGKLYEAGNIISTYYPTENFPNEASLRKDIFRFLALYDELTYNDTESKEEIELTFFEKKQYRLHLRIERNTSIAKKVKQIKGYVCEACDMQFIDKYGDIGNNYIEAHHLTPISSLGIGKFKINIEKDFAVLCSNCHSMIHRLERS